LLLVALAAVLWQVFETAGNRRARIHDPTASAPPITPRGDLAQDEQATIELFKRCSPAVVHITTVAVRRGRFLFEPDQVAQGTGSGFVWDAADGYIVTNFHVIQGAEEAKVTLTDGSVWNARLVGVAPDKDLAVLKIEAPASQLGRLDVGTSADLQVGQKVFAIGNPFGLDQTLTTGIISGLGREIESITRRPIQGVIQTDAAINPGNSGGPLLDSSGRLIGVNTAIYSPSGVNSGVGFAVPVDIVREVVPQLIRSGKVDRPGMGIKIASDQALRRIGETGVLVLEAVRGGAAAAAGIRGTTVTTEGEIVTLGDRIIAVNQKPVRDSQDLHKALDQFGVGATVTVTVVRDGAKIDLPVTLQAID
jgi:S1-C subfamily serine protease